MKKFCSTCGNQLELSQRFCSECGAVNPFFIPSFTLLADKTDTLEKLRLEKERIEKELAEHEAEQKEFEKQEQLKKEIEELEKQKQERAEKERLAREKAERERLEANLKKEILRVKEDTEQYKKETIDLVKEMRGELQQIEENSRLLKQEIEQLSKQNTALREETEPAVVPEVPIAERKTVSRFAMAILLIVVGTGIALAVIYFTQMRTDATAVSSNQSTKDSTVVANADTAANSNVQPTDTVKSNTLQMADASANNRTTNYSTSPADVSAVRKHTSAATGQKANEESAVETPVRNGNSFSISEEKVKTDLVGKKLSGCGVVINSYAEVEGLSNLVFIEKLGSGQLKYKCTARIAQGADSYTAVPYLYYSTDGILQKIDGTNCE